MNTAIVIPTHNRLSYTQKVIPRLLEDPNEEFELYLWDNASSDETPEYLKSLKDPRIKAVHLNTTNAGQVGAMNWAWSQTSAELVGKLDNDCLATPGWTRTFAAAHRDIPHLGAVGMWHFFEDDFVYERARHKIQEFNGHRIFRHPWVAGSGFILKRRTFQEMGLWREGDMTGTTYYFMNMALAGYVNGWYYPLVYQEHMDDPKSSYCLIQDQESFDKHKAITFGLKANRYHDIDGRMKRRQEIVRNLLDDPYDARYYIGWRKRWRLFKYKLGRVFAK